MEAAVGWAGCRVMWCRGGHLVWKTAGLEHAEGLLWVCSVQEGWDHPSGLFDPE